MDDPRLDLIVSAVVVKVVGELKAEFWPPHEQTRSELAELRSTVVQLVNTVAGLVNTVRGLEARMGEIEQYAGANFYISQAMGENPASQPLPAERPAAIDRACAVAGTPDAQPAIIPQYGNLVVYPKVGYSPAQVYDDVVRSVEDVRSTIVGGGSSEATGLRRTRRARKH